jgi:hypothetical protein
MTRVWALLVAVATPLAATPARAEEAADRQALRQAIDHYVAGEYQRAVAVLRPLVEARVLRDRADQREALRTYGVALYLTGARAAAERAFRDLLRLDSAARLHPSFVRPEVVAFFERVRTAHAAEQTRLVRRHAPRGSALVNLLPPWGQFRNGHRTKAKVLLVGELSLATVSAVTAGLLYAWRSSTGEFGDKEPAYRPLQLTNAISFGALAVLVVYGVVDGLYHYYRGPPRI